MLQVAHQLDGAIVRAGDAHVDGDVAVLFAHGLDSQYLHAWGKNGLHRFHGEGPGEALVIEDLVERLRLVEHARVGRQAHDVFGALALGLDLCDLAVDLVFARPSGRGAVIEKMKAESEEDAKCGENAHGDAQAAHGRTEIGKWASGEIERDAHRSIWLPRVRPLRPRNWFGAAWSRRRSPAAAPNRRR